MPRTSRKPKAVQTAAIPEVKEIVYNTGLYLRLSLMDSGIKGGESIINQQELLERYVAEKPELSLKGVFTDNGETGTDYDRPAWNDLMRECRAGKINCIIVRDLSRLGRNYIETGELLEKILPMLGVRLISINDNYDNLHLTLNEQLVANLKNLINDIYSKDIGRKVSTAVRAKKKNGEFMGTFAAYGYLKDPLDKHRLIIDPETAPTIVQIFEWKAQGLSHAEICRQLNESGISNPAYYRYEKGILTSERYSRREWITATVKNILENPVYLGHVAQGKKSSDLSTGQRQKRTSREDWIIVENTHAPIITQELYNQAHAVMRERTQKSLDGRKKHENV
ncbi:MAG: recombinase family protein, partial [Defluviitaleaceae bacterium]|nr:recombinase family protein [Defluviitaleaceae bacterium]